MENKTYKIENNTLYVYKNHTYHEEVEIINEYEEYEDVHPWYKEVEKIEEIILDKELDISNLSNFNIHYNLKKITISKFSKGIEGELKNLEKLEEIIVPKESDEYSSQDGILYNKNKTELIFCPKNIKIKSLIIPDSVTKIAGRAFLRNKNIESIKIGKNVQSIGIDAFLDCKKINFI